MASQRPHVPDEEFCTRCHAHNVDQRETLTKTLVHALRKLAAFRGPVHRETLGLTTSESGNWSKLQFWGFARWVSSGTWEITQKGRDFLSGHAAVPHACWTYRGAVVEWEGRQTYVTEVGVRVRTREDYVAEQRPHRD